MDVLHDGVNDAPETCRLDNGSEDRFTEGKLSWNGCEQSIDGK